MNGLRNVVQPPWLTLGLLGRVECKLEGPTLVDERIGFVYLQEIQEVGGSLHSLGDICDS